MELDVQIFRSRIIHSMQIKCFLQPLHLLPRHSQAPVCSLMIPVHRFGIRLLHAPPLLVQPPEIECAFARPWSAAFLNQSATSEYGYVTPWPS